MQRKMMIVPVFVLLVSLPLVAQASSKTTKKIQKWEGTLARVEERLPRSITRKIYEQMKVNPAAFEAYKNEVAQIQVERLGKTPTYNELIPALKKMAEEYNKIFRNPSVPTEEKAQLAAFLNQEVWGGWNSYRRINLKEILDTDFREANPDAQVEEFEYSIRYFLLPEKQREDITAFKHAQNAQLAGFRAAYTDFEFALQNMAAFDTKAVAKILTNVVNAYNEVLAVSKEDAAFIKAAAFAKPLLTGWGRTVNMDWIRKIVGSHYFTDCGDGVSCYKPQELQKWYGLSEQDAKALVQFTKEFHRPVR